MADGAATKVAALFARRGWGSLAPPPSRLLRLTEEGRFVVERSAAFGVCLSYRPMLRRLGEAAFGEAAAVFKHAHGREAWVDRTINVVASGFMHARYFADMTRVLVRRLFDEAPLAEQPRVVADMGCGDGTLLKTARAAASFLSRASQQPL